MGYLNSLLVEFTILLLCAGGVRMLLAYLGREFIGVSGIMGIAAYAVVVGTQGLAVGLPVVVLALLACIALVALVDAISDDQGFALATLLITMSFPGIVRNLDSIGGAFGLRMDSPLRLSDHVAVVAAAAIAVTGAMFLLERTLRDSYLGRAALVVKAYRHEALFLGLSPLRNRVAVIAIGILTVWLAALFYVLEFAYVAPESFPAMPALMALSIGLIAQRRSFGAFYGVTILIFVTDVLVRYIALSPEHVGNWRMIIFGAIIVAVATVRR